VPWRVCDRGALGMLCARQEHGYSKGTHVLDAGCGTGKRTQAIVTHVDLGAASTAGRFAGIAEITNYGWI
jgi:ubiquinone/menaquinone biosynthesis C-methylase UbiE